MPTAFRPGAERCHSQQKRSTRAARPANRRLRGPSATAALTVVLLATGTIPALTGAGGAAAATSAGAAGRVTPAAAATSLRAWGTDNDGELGNGATGTYFDMPVTVKVPQGTRVTSVRAGCNHSGTLASPRTGARLGRQRRRPARQRQHDRQRHPSRGHAAARYQGDGGERRLLPQHGPDLERRRVHVGVQRRGTGRRR